MGTDTRAMENLFATVSLGAPENAVGFVLWRVVHRYVREIDRALAPLDITHLQFTTLTLAAWLGRSGNAVTQRELARFGDIHPMQVSLMLKALEGKAMVTRLRSRSDVRAKYVELTRAGMETLYRALPIVINVQQRLFGDQGRPGGALLALLQQMEHDRSSGYSASVFPGLIVY